MVRKIILPEVRIPVYVLLIASLVTCTQIIMEAFMYTLYESLGIFIALIATNCIIIGRAEAFASKNGPVASLCDGIATGIGFTLALVCVAAVRELLGSGMLFAASDGTGGVQIFGDWFSPATIFLMPSGAFITLGFIVALVQRIQNNAKERALQKELKNDALESGYQINMVGHAVEAARSKPAENSPVTYDGPDSRVNN